MPEFFLLEQLKHKIKNPRKRQKNGGWHSFLGPVGPKTFAEMMRSTEKVRMNHVENPPFVLSRKFWDNDETLFRYDVVKTHPNPGSFWEPQRKGLKSNIVLVDIHLNEDKFEFFSP